MRKLQLFNGRPYGPLPQRMWKRGGDQARIYVAAYSMADARRVCVEAGLSDPGAREVKEYWAPCWGIGMKDISPERGIWITYGWSGTPERVIKQVEVEYAT